MSLAKRILLLSDHVCPVVTLALPLFLSRLLCKVTRLVKIPLTRNLFLWHLLIGRVEKGKKQ